MLVQNQENIFKSFMMFKNKKQKRHGYFQEISFSKITFYLKLLWDQQ